MPDSTYIPHSPYLNGVHVITPQGACEAIVFMANYMVHPCPLPGDEDYDRVEEWLRG